MTISYPTSMKYVISILCTIMLTVGSMYAIDIVNLSQTANTGDKITPAWVNAVNTASVSASSFSNLDCTNGYNGAISWTITCVNKQTGKSEPGTCTLMLDTRTGNSESRAAATLAMMGNCSL